MIRNYGDFLTKIELCHRNNPHVASTIRECDLVNRTKYVSITFRHFDIRNSIYLCSTKLFPVVCLRFASADSPSYTRRHMCIWNADRVYVQIGDGGEELKRERESGRWIIGPHALEWTAPCALSALGFFSRSSGRARARDRSHQGEGVYFHMYIRFSI